MHTDGSRRWHGGQRSNRPTRSTPPRHPPRLRTAPAAAALPRCAFWPRWSASTAGSAAGPATTTATMRACAAPALRRRGGRRGPPSLDFLFGDVRERRDADGGAGRGGQAEHVPAAGARASRSRTVSVMNSGLPRVRSTSASMSGASRSPDPSWAARATTSLTGERFDHDLGTEPAQLRQDSAELGRRRRVLRAVGHQQAGSALADRRRKVHEYCHGRRVGPVRVVEHGEHRRGRRGAARRRRTGLPARRAVGSDGGPRRSPTPRASSSAATAIAPAGVDACAAAAQATCHPSLRVDEHGVA